MKVARISSNPNISAYHNKTWVQWAQINRKDKKVTLIQKNNKDHYPKKIIQNNNLIKPKKSMPIPHHQTQHQIQKQVQTHPQPNQKQSN